MTITVIPTDQDIKVKIRKTDKRPETKAKPHPHIRKQEGFREY